LLATYILHKNRISQNNIRLPISHKKIISSYKQVSRNKIRSKLVLLLIFVVKELQKLIREFAHAAQVELSKAEDTGEFSPRSTREVQGYFYSFPRQKKDICICKNRLRWEVPLLAELLNMSQTKSYLL
jgi:hypothetical protein